MNIFILLLLSFIGVLIGKRFIKRYGKDNWMNGIESLLLVTCLTMLLHISLNDGIGQQARELCYIERNILRVLVLVSGISLFFLHDNDNDNDNNE